MGTWREDVETLKGEWRKRARLYAIESVEATDVGRQMAQDARAMMCSDHADELDALVAAHREPVGEPPTCATCKFQVAADRMCQLMLLLSHVEIRLQIEAQNVNPFERAEPVIRPGDNRFYCQMHVPAATRGEETTR